MSIKKFRPKAHIAPYKGWLNDPNGLCQYKGEYHVFFQAIEDYPKSNLKCWGHYSSKDLVNFNYNNMAIIPTIDLDSSGVYSGSAIECNDVLYLFYTGNYKLEGNYDYINEGRLSSVICVSTTDGRNFSEKKIILEQHEYPEYYSNHVRDPKVYFKDGLYYMILGGRTKDSKGALLYYKSKDCINWSFDKDEIYDDLGYMLECPDVLYVDDKEIFSFSPQGVTKKDEMFRNIFSAGYCINNISLANYIEWDKGYDFYAPQTFKDSKGRNILLGWAGIDDKLCIPQYDNTLEEGWIHCMTTFREITYKNNQLYTFPIEEVLDLANNYIKTDESNLDSFMSKIGVENNSFELLINDAFKLSYKDNLIKLEFIKDSYGREERTLKIDKLDNVFIFNDSSIIEIYFNDGEYVFTTRCFSNESGFKLLKGNVTCLISDVKEYKYK